MTADREERRMAARAALEVCPEAPPEHVERLRRGADAGGQPAPPSNTARPLDEEGKLALRRAVMLLSVRGLPTAELRRRLARRYTPAAVEGALAALAGTPFLDDRAWASAYVAGTRGRERSTALLRRELRAKGVSPVDAAAAVEAHDDREAALAAGRKRLRTLAGLEASVRTRRLRDYLLRRGFGGATVREVLAALDAGPEPGRGACPEPRRGAGERDADEFGAAGRTTEDDTGRR